MKKQLLLFIFIWATYSVSAQINTNSDGDVAIKGGFKPGYGLSVVASKNPIIGVHENGTMTWQNGIEGHTRPESSAMGVGLLGTAYNKTHTGTQGRYMGVLGQAGYATSGYNYGIFGQLYDTQYNGAGVYGTIYSTDTGVNTGGRYAGYFTGPVKIDGNLTVTGTINGVVIGPSSIARNAQSSLDNVSLSDRLQVLSAQVFQLAEPVSDETATNVDTLETVFPMTAMEKQVLSKKHYGLSPEQIEEVFPDLVYENEDGSKSINYVEMVPILVQVMNELNARIKVLESQKRALSDGTQAKKLQKKQIVVYP